MFANFYVFIREYYAAYAPEEGGYYVWCSRITHCEDCGDDLNVALNTYKEWVDDEIADGHTVYGRSDYAGLKTYTNVINDEVVEEVRFKMPWCEFDYTGYIGDGFLIGIATERPQDEPYTGYC